MQAMTERLAKLEGSFDVAKVAFTLLSAVMLGGFALLSGQMLSLSSRIDAVSGKIDVVSIKVAEMPGVFRSDLQAATEKLMLAISTGRQSGSITRPGAPFDPVLGYVPPAPGTPAQPTTQPANGGIGR
jgi:hypothetical protein